MVLPLTLAVMSLQSSEELECKDDTSQEDEGFMGMSPLLQAHHAMERMEEFVCKVRLPFPNRRGKKVVVICFLSYLGGKSMARWREIILLTLTC